MYRPDEGCRVLRFHVALTQSFVHMGGVSAILSWTISTIFCGELQWGRAVTAENPQAVPTSPVCQYQIRAEKRA